MFVAVYMSVLWWDFLICHVSELCVPISYLVDVFTGAPCTCVMYVTHTRWLHVSVYVAIPLVNWSNWYMQCSVCSFVYAVFLHHPVHVSVSLQLCVLLCMYCTELSVLRRDCFASSCICIVYIAGRWLKTLRSEESLCSQRGPTIGEGHPGRQRQRETSMANTWYVRLSMQPHHSAV